ncbi:MAG TPA: hypothetical protein EYQ50_19015 [Verrucomicrobiales bacterium]|nr:hypothetical protein [Verrucomicrobiales bacterium]HIL71826.1 hypothetical protein [Verrucomicrobiota bacterium]
MLHNMIEKLTRFIKTVFCLAAILIVHPSTVIQAQDASSLEIAPLGNTVELSLDTPTEDSYILETQAVLMEGEEWEPLMQFRGNATQPRNWVDPICGDKDAKYFRLRQLLEAPRTEISNFRLNSLNGKAYELYYEWPSTGILLFLTGDTLAPALEIQEELNRLRELYGEHELLTWIISVSDLDESDALAEASSEFPLLLPVLQDISHTVTRTLGSGIAPEVLLINPKDWSLSYRGPALVTIDTGGSEINLTPLQDAIEELFEGNSPVVARMASIGNPSGVSAVPPSTYSDQIAPILQAKCFPCHTPGNIAPWVMSDYSIIQEFSGLIKSAVLAGEMPPWHADPKHQTYSNSKALSKDETATLIDWIDRGSPRGDGLDPLVENPAPKTVNWPMGLPDAVISIPLQSIPSNGVVDYKYLTATNPFPNDVWLKAISVNPGDRSVVHHCLVFKGSFAELLALRGGLAGFFAGYVPGMEQVAFPEGSGKLLKKSDIIIFQMHYTVSGKATTDKTQLGFYLAEGPPEKELITSSAYETDLFIPPHSKEVKISARRTFKKASTLYEFSPHMHFRGSSARYTLNYPDGTSEIILNVPAYFFDWQTLYRLETPISVPAGTVLHCEGIFDNSKQNRFNPDPNASVRFGEQSWEEMFIGYFNYTEN